MALNSGIKCSQGLLDAVSLCADLAYIVKIKEEEFVLENTLEKSSFQETLDSIVLENTCYVVFKKENLLITYIPDTERVREKMLYASSKGILSKELGIKGVKWDISTSKELNYDGYLQLFKKDLAFTEKELEQQKVKNDLALVDTSSNTRQGHIVSLQFQTCPNLLKGMQELKQKGQGGKLGENDVLELETKVESNEILEFSNGFKDSSPRFGYYLDGKNKGMHSRLRQVFVYLCPNKAAVKEKMKYSSARPSAVQIGTNVFAEEFKRIELDDVTEIMQEIKGLTKDLPATKSTDSLRFSKPMRPAGSRPKLNLN